RSQGTESVNALAEGEDSGLHLPPLDVPRCHIVEDDVSADVFPSLLRREVFARLFQNHRKLELVVELLGEVFRVNYRLLVANVGAHILKNQNPRRNRREEPVFVAFLMVLKKIPRRMEELLRFDGSSKSDLFAAVHQGFTRGAGGPRSLFLRMFEGP